MDSKDPLFGHSNSPAALPITVRLLGSSPSLAAPARPPQPQPLSAEEFHLIDQNGQPLYELQPLGGPSTQMVSTSEAGQVGKSVALELFEGPLYRVLVCCNSQLIQS